MAGEMDRRRVLALLGGAVVLGACTPGRDDRGPARASGTAPPATLGTAAAGALTAASFARAGTCTRTPEQTEGPFYLDVDDVRPDIRDGRPGTRLRVGTRVVEVDACTPVRDALVDLWHCDAAGDYSGFEGGGRTDTRYLRGAQRTNAEGIAEITTIFPGWYPGRTPHIHAKVFLGDASALTTQLYFDDAVADEVYRAAPYDTRGAGRATNADDRIFSADTVMSAARDGDGLLALLTIAVAR